MKNEERKVERVGGAQAKILLQATTNGKVTYEECCGYYTCEAGALNGIRQMVKWGYLTRRYLGEDDVYIPTRKAREWFEAKKKK